MILRGRLKRRRVWFWGLIQNLFYRKSKERHLDENIILEGRKGYPLFVPEEFDKCDCCLECSLFCPTQAIKIKSSDKREGKTPASFIIELKKCVQCGLCFEKCPQNCLDSSGIDFDVATINIIEVAKN